MTEVSQRPRTAESASAVVTEFFDRYRAHDIDGMTDLCSVNAGFSYVPVEIWGKQRVLRGDGKVCTVGKPLWTGLVASFPNLSNTVHSLVGNDDGDVVAEVDIEGTQQLAWGLVTPAGLFQQVAFSLIRVQGRSPWPWREYRPANARRSHCRELRSGEISDRIDAESEVRIRAQSCRYNSSTWWSWQSGWMASCSCCRNSRP